MAASLPHSSTPPAEALREALRGEALRLGFARAGFTTAEPLTGATERRWRRWLSEGKAGVMHYLTRETPRRTHPRDLLETAQSILVVLAGYYQGDHPAPPTETGDPQFAPGKVARYAWGEDYHQVLRERLTRLGEYAARRAEEASLAAPVQFRPCVDSAPLDERALAVRAGLGFIGKNTLLLTPGHGSWAVIGMLLLSLPLPPDAPLAPAPTASCGACRRCLEACPTGALTGPYQLDPRRCLSYQTIEQREAIAPELAGKMSGWAFGCDRCQEVCPHNAQPLTVQLKAFRAERGCGPWVSAGSLGLPLSGKAFARRWAHSPLARAGLKGIVRNLKTLGAAPPVTE